MSRIPVLPSASPVTVRPPLNRTVRGLLPAAMLLVLAGCSPQTPVSLKPLPDRPWTVLPGDEVRVRVYREPELNGQWIVNGKGEVYVPGLGRIIAAGLTADSLSTIITAGYSKRIIDAIVDVGILRNLPVLGQVRFPGVYQVEPTMTVQQVVAKTGGVTGASVKAPTFLLQKGGSDLRYALSADIRLDRIALDEGDAILVVDPSLLQRWTPALSTFNLFGGTINILLSILLLSKK